MRNPKKIINSILKNLSIYFNNIDEFQNKILSNKCILSGSFILNHINKIYKYNIRNNHDIVEIYCEKEEYKKLKLFLILNNFNIDINNKNINSYYKSVDYNNFLINIYIVVNPIDYIFTHKLLKIEKNYFNGGLLVIGYPKNVILKYEKLIINDINLINNNHNIIKYLNYGYKFKFYNNMNNKIYILYNKTQYTKYLNYIKYILYNLNIYLE